MKVLHLVHWQKSGIYVAVDALKSEGMKNNDQHDIVVLRNDSSAIGVFMSIIYFLKFIYKAIFCNYDRINLHSFLPFMASFLCSEKKTSLFFHSNYPFLQGKTKKDKIKLSLTKISSRGNGIFTVSNIVKKSVDRALNTNSKISYNIIKLQKNSSKTSSVIELGSAGRFDPEKRFFEITKAFSHIQTTSNLHLAGDGRMLEQIKLYVDQRKSKNIFFHGRQESMENFYNMIDAYICCSAFEGFGLAIAEAMIHGKVLISTKVGILCENFDFKFLEVNPDLSNLTDCIKSAENLDKNVIDFMTETNRKILAENFRDDSIYKMYKQYQLEIK